jgi:hypothetical protein
VEVSRAIEFIDLVYGEVSKARADYIEMRVEYERLGE